MSKIYIIGFMGSGKSYTGKRLARHLGYAFADLDTLFEDKFHFTIQDFFNAFGEDAFRKLERELLLTTKSFENTVISTGGGTPCHLDNMSFIKEQGVSVYLKMTPEKVLSRLSNSKKPRPLIWGVKGEDRLIRIRDLIKTREFFYEQADIILDTSFKNPSEILETVKIQLRSRGILFNQDVS